MAVPWVRCYRVLILSALFAAGEFSCTVPVIETGADSWSISVGCVSGGTVADGETCNIVALDGYTCTSPGLCNGGSFAAVGICTESPCTVPLVPRGVASWAGTDCAGGGTVSHSTTCTIIPTTGYSCVSPGMCAKGVFAAAARCDGPPCALPAVALSTAVGIWSGAGCSGGAAEIPDGASCGLVAAAGYECTEPGECFGGNFARLASCRTQVPHSSDGELKITLLSDSNSFTIAEHTAILADIPGFVAPLRVAGAENNDVSLASIDSTTQIRVIINLAEHTSVADVARRATELRSAAGGSLGGLPIVTIVGSGGAADPSATEAVEATLTFGPHGTALTAKELAALRSAIVSHYSASGFAPVSLELRSASRRRRRRRATNDVVATTRFALGVSKVAVSEASKVAEIGGWALLSASVAYYNTNGGSDTAGTTAGIGAGIGAGLVLLAVVVHVHHVKSHKRKVAASAAAADAVVRGQCGACYEDVYTTHERLVDTQGQYYHKDCAPLEVSRYSLHAHCPIASRRSILRRVSVKPSEKAVYCCIQLPVARARVMPHDHALIALRQLAIATAFIQSQLDATRSESAGAGARGARRTTLGRLPALQGSSAARGRWETARGRVWSALTFASREKAQVAVDAKPIQIVVDQHVSTSHLDVMVDDVENWPVISV